MNILLALRPLNLIIIGLLQWIFYDRFIDNICLQYNLESIFSEGRIMYFIAVSILLAATGYLINDYIDFEGDIRNNKSGRLTSRSLILVLYFSLLIPAFGLAYYLAVLVGYPLLSVLFVLAAALLAIYAIHLKGWSMIGNLFVAAICSLGVLIIPLSDFRILLELKTNDAEQFNHTVSVFFVYGAFAFLITIIRELVKDIEDIEGDEAMGLKTFPILYGVPRTKLMSIFYAFVLFITMLLSLFYFSAFRQNNYVVFGSVIILIMMLLLLIFLYFAQSKKQYNRISLLSKTIMIAGIILLINLPWT